MAQAVLDIYASAEDSASLQDEELRTTSWNGMDVDSHYISNIIFSRID